jgi:hypothetical protein
MKRIFAIALLAAASFVTANSASAQSQNNKVQATIPFNFTVNGTAVPAGTYTIGSTSSGSALLEIADRTDGVHVMVLSMPESQPANSSYNGKLIFHKYGDQYFLAEICGGSSALDVAFPTSKAEKRAKSQTQEAGLRINNDVLIALK